MSRTGATSTAASADPVQNARHFLRRYAFDTLARIKQFARPRQRGRVAPVLHGDSRQLDWEGTFDGAITSPPYPGLIDYHEQHRYAYELLELDDRRELELGAAASGTSRAALAVYAEGIAAIVRRAAAAIKPGAPLVVVVNDRRDLYPASWKERASSSSSATGDTSTGARVARPASSSTTFSSARSCASGV